MMNSVRAISPFPSLSMKVKLSTMPTGALQYAGASDQPILVLLDNFDLQTKQFVRRDGCEHSPLFCSIVLVDDPVTDL